MKEAEVRRQHTDHRVAGVIERYAATNDVWFAVVTPLPQGVTEDDDALAAWFVFRGVEVAPRRQRLNAEQRQQTR
jgi:hypothetical protein